MTDEERELTNDELEETEGEPLPDREAMSIVTPTPGEDVWTQPIEPPAT